MKMVKPAIIRALKRMYDGDEFLALEKISERLVQEALHGEHSSKLSRLSTTALKARPCSRYQPSLT